jgi:hypothetical protein
MERINEIIKDFVKVCQIAKLDLNENDIRIEPLIAGNEHLPRKLEKNFMAVYIFIDPNYEICYKVGKVGTNSNARYQTQHYSPNSSKSNLAKSLLNDHDRNDNIELQNDVGQWIKDNTTKINLIISTEKKVLTLNLLESFVQCRLNPIYEGYKSQRK